MRSVTVIPASVNKFSAQPLSATEKRKVAAYARVSTDEEEQQTSYAAQCDYYERYIKSRADWAFVKVYADEGISGCNTRKREAFKAMVQDALDGKIQLILTKSVSRFARNTVDSLTTIRKLKEHGVEVWFEKENLKTFDPKVEMLLTILASLSQEESRSISENVNWGIRKKMTDGKFSLGYSHFLGYDKGVDGSLIINEEEAKVIRRIYALYIKGMSPYGIAKVLTEEGIKTPGGKTRWRDSTVKSILRNEKYCGRALLQKTFTPDFLTKKTVKNTGQVPSYYVEHSHAPIIDPDVYDMVQRMMEGRKRGRDRISSVSIFSSKLRCGDCGSWYGSKTWHSTDKYKRVIWQCNHTAEPRRRRTAGYARVSTDHEEQASSYEMQMAHYKNYIGSRADWDFVGMYSDEGISGTNTKKRDGFNQMIEDALAGKIDLIITKSVSRFARNTVDSLQNVRKLKENGVEIYFEKENIWTFDTRGELLITIMSSLAQEESRSISENTTWGKRKQFAEGKTSVGYSAFLGYDKDFKVNPEQAQVVKLIYKLFLGDRSFYAITKDMEKRGIKSPSGKDKWYISTVRSILTNEKYRGDALIQKEYTADFLDKTRRKNTGEIPQYYVEEHHEAIIPPDLFDFVQSEIKRREQNGKHSGVSIFANKIKCGCCGGWYGAKVWHSTDKYRRVIYRCNKKYAHKGKPCSTQHLTEEKIKRIFVKALNSLVEVKENVITELRSLIDGVCQTGELLEERDKVEQELRDLAEHLETLIHENVRVAQDQTAYLKQENEIRARYLEKQRDLKALDEQIAEREGKRNILEGMIQVVCGINGEQVEFDEELWSGLLEHIVVKEGGAAVVVFKGGIEIDVI